VRPAAGHRHAESLCIADHDVGAEFTRGTSSVSASRSAATMKLLLGVRHLDEAA